MQEGDTSQGFQVLQEPSMLFLKALPAMFLSYWLKCSPSFQVKIRKHYKSEFLKQKYFQKGLMSLQAPDISEHLSVSSVIFGRTSDEPATSVHWQIADSTGHIKVAASERIAWEVVSLKLCLFNNAPLFCPLRHLFSSDLIQRVD